MAIRFTDLSKADIPAVVRIYNWYIKHSTATFHTEPMAEDGLFEFLYVDHPRYKSFMIHDDNAQVGYCFLTPYKKRQAYDRTAEVTIYLDPDSTGKGYGSLALAHLEVVAREVGLKNLIGIISGDNEGSIRLFSRAGFDKVAHFRNVGEKFNNIIDVVAYQKELDP